MSAQDFLSVVLPSSGFYCVAGFTNKKKQHFYTDNIEEIETEGQLFLNDKNDVYIALSTFREKGKRTAANALYVRSFFMDLDVDPDDATKYSSKQAAASAFNDFLQTSSLAALGTPWIVSSGGGLHVYWPLAEQVLIDQWKPVAEALKRLAKKQALRIDFTVTADAARILRVPGTMNFKIPGRPRAVKVLVEGDTFAFDDISAVMRERLNGEFPAAVAAPRVESEIALPGARPKGASTSAVRLLENVEARFKDLLTKTSAGDGCKQLTHYIEHATDGGMEPLWRGWLTIAKQCTDGEKAARWLSSLHPYPEERMRTKLREARGFYLCSKFDSENPGGCEGCKHIGRIATPLALAQSVQVDNEEREVEAPAPLAAMAVSATPIQVTRPTPPPGYSYGRAGGVYKERVEVDAQGNNVTTMVPILPYDLFVVDILQNPEGEHVVHMLALRPMGSVQVTLPQRAVVSKDDTCKELAQQNVVSAIGSGNDKNLFEYVRACVEEASVTRHTVKVPASYGWQDDGTFVHSERIFAPGVPPRIVPMLELGNINKSTQPSGSLDHWRAVNKLLIGRKQYNIIAMSLVGFGAPLMKFTGFYGMTYHLGSTQSGTGKTLALELAASIWGHPVHYRVGKKTSDVAMQQRLGMLNSLPLVCDEITDKNRRDFEWFPAFLFDMTEGRGKERMESGANKERLNLSTWSSLALMSSNTHVTDYLTGARKHSSEGELRRLLEMTMEQQIVWQPHEVVTLKLLHENYGTAGPVYAQFLVDNPDVVQDVVRQTEESLYKRFSATNDERYWMAGAVACIAGAVLCSDKYAGIINYPVNALAEEHQLLVEKARTTVRTSARSADDVLNSYTRDYYGKFVVVRRLNNALAATLGEGGTIDESITRSQISGRVEHGVQPGFVAYYIEEQLLKAYCSSMSFGYADFKAQLERMYMISYSKKDLMHGTKGPQMRVNCICITRAIEAEEAPED
jgi:hypothetical protein